MAGTQQQYYAARLLFRGGGAGAESTFSNAVVWTSSDQSVFTVDQQGLVTAVGPGRAALLVQAANGPAHGETTITVSATALTSIAVNPANLTIPKGLSRQYHSMGKFADNSTLDLTDVAVWSSDSGVAVISNAPGSQAFLSTAGVGTANIQASVDSVTGSATLTVSPPVPASIQIAPTTATILAGATLSYNGTVTLTDGSVQTLTGATWNSSNPLVAGINSNGVANGEAPGVTDIYAQFSGLTSNTAALTVNFRGLVSGPSPFATGCQVVPQSQRSVNYENAEVEPWLAVDPTDPQHLIGIWQQDRWNNGGAHGLVTAVSHDGGVTWTTNHPHFSVCAGGNSSNGGNYERSSDPWLSFSSNGTAYAISLSFDTADANQAILVAKSTDGGSSWSEPQTLKFDNQFQIVDDKESITADPLNSSYIYAAWHRTTYADSFQTVFVSDVTWFARSTNGGTTWSASAIYNPGSNLATVGNEIVVLPTGTLVNFFQVYNVNQPTKASQVVIRSVDHGASWSAPITVSSYDDVGVVDVETGEPIRDGIGHIAVNAQTGTLYVAWPDARFSGGVRDGILLSSSTDGGLTWSNPVQVNQARNVQAFGPGISVAADGSIAIGYYDFRNDTPDPSTLLTTYWRIVSRDGGNSWNETVLAPPFDIRTAPFTGLGYMVTDYEGLVPTVPFVSLFSAANSGNASNRTDIFTFVAGAKGELRMMENNRLEINPSPQMPGEILAGHREVNRTPQ